MKLEIDNNGHELEGRVYSSRLTQSTQKNKEMHNHVKIKPTWYLRG